MRPACAILVLLAVVSVAAPASVAASRSSILRVGVVPAERAGTPPAGPALELRPGRAVRRTVDLPGEVRRVVLRARSGQCGASIRLAIDGRRVVAGRIARGRRVTLRARVRLRAGRHRVRVAAGRRGRCRAPLRVRPVALVLARDRNPLAGQRWWVDPGSDAARTEAAWRAEGRTADADHMHLIASHPAAAWFGGWSADPGAAVRRHLAKVAASGATQGLVVVYQVDLRARCSAGAARRYASWIRSFAAGMGRRRVAVVLEPDGLGLLGGECRTRADRRRQLRMLRDAVRVLAANPRAAVYLDAGTTGWIPAGAMADRLRAAGVRYARGIALNVSNFGSTPDQIAYGTRVLGALGLPGKGMVVDTSRNGNGPDGGWCNPPGRALGRAPTAAVRSPLLDALLWIKVPGQSDGDGPGCDRAGPPPPAGRWWPEYALGLARRHRLAG